MVQYSNVGILMVCINDETERTSVGGAVPLKANILLYFHHYLSL